MPKIVLIGPLPVDYESIGGAQVAFRELCDHFLQNRCCDISVINTSRPVARTVGVERFVKNIFAFLRIYAKVLSKIIDCDLVMVNLSVGGSFLFGLPIVLTCRIFGKKVALRFFGGQVHQLYRSKNLLSRHIFRKMIGYCEVIYAETKISCEEMKQAKNVSWFPNTRNMPKRKLALRNQVSRALFLSQVKKSKGVEDIIIAKQFINCDIKISIVGPMFDCEEIFLRNLDSDIEYLGAVKHHDVQDILEQHDILLLPSKWKNEGYPGVVIEAMQLGIPAVVSNLPSLKELVVDGHNGLVVAESSPKDISSAINLLASNTELFREMQVAAFMIGEEYREESVFARVEGQILSLASMNKSSKNHPNIV